MKGSRTSLQNQPLRRASAVMILVVILMGAGVLAGCTAPTGTDVGTPDELPRCDHPWPCADGTEWPTDLTGPFDLQPVEAVRFESHDGVELETYVYHPDLPEGVRAPTVLWSQPYTGGCAFNAVAGTGECVPTGNSDFIRDGGMRVNVRLLVESGYTVVVSNVRGTGNSGGCFSFGGLDEQKDQLALVEWIAEQSWSNGRVSMYGHSYHGYTPWMAANHAPEALKTIVASGLVTDPYTFYHTPQGAPLDIGGPFQAAMTLTLNNVPPLGGDPEHATLDHVGVAPERACPGLVGTFGEASMAQYSDSRNEAWWQERRLVEDFDQISAAVLVSHGFNDDSGHAFQEDIVWNTLTKAPKRFILGQWGHDLPPPESYLADAPFGSDWHEDVLIPWLDFWLKGIGGPDRLGTVSHQAQDESWRETTSWPPADVQEEVLYLTTNGLTPEPGEGSKEFVAGPSPVDPACAPGLHPPTQDDENWLVYSTKPLDAPVTLAGNPFAYLKIASNLPGGTVSVDLFDIAPDGECAKVHGLAGGAADLRFHEGDFQGQDFPTGEPTAVRVDLHNEAWTYEEGHRVAVILSGQGWWVHQGQPYTPQITVQADESHIVLPLVNGTLGGEAPRVEYPPRPFDPASG